MTPVNAPPVFTSPATVSVAENTGLVYRPLASDPEGAPLTYSIAGGPDGGQFTISNGNLTFFNPAPGGGVVLAPDFEVPGDADRNNVYLVTLRVTDGTNVTTLDLAVTVTNVVEQFSARRIASGLTEPVYVAAVPGDTRVFVLERAGRILLLDPATGTTSVFMSIAGTIVSTEKFAVGGLQAIAPAPDYATSGVFYLYANNAAGDLEVRRYTRKNANEGDATSGDVILRVAAPPQDVVSGWLGFGPHDGMLYVTTDRGGEATDTNSNAQNLASRLGKVLRIDVRSDAFPADPSRDYAIPAGNPFANGAAPEIFAYGFHEPYRASFDGSSLYVGDRGGSYIEEVDLVRPEDAGANYGWPFFEGTESNRASPPGLTAPVTQYGHGGRAFQGEDIVGGYVYRGPVGPLQGRYVFGDGQSGNLWTVTGLTQGKLTTTDSFVRINQELDPANAIRRPVSFGEDAARNLYIVNAFGEVFMVVPAG